LLPSCCNLRALACGLPFEPTRDPFAVLGAQTLSDLAVHSALFHFQVHQRNCRLWLTVNPLCRETPVVNARVNVRLAQRVVRKRCPAFPQAYVLLAVVGQTATAAFA
jgi:hypothetical protein